MTAHASIAFFLLAASLSASGASFNVQPWPLDGRFHYGDYGASLAMTLSFDGPACPLSRADYPLPTATQTFIVDGAVFWSYTKYVVDRSCADGKWNLNDWAILPTLDMGAHDIVVRYQLDTLLSETLASGPVSVVVMPGMTVPTPGGLGNIGFGFAEVAPLPAAQCRVDSLTISDSPVVPAPPQELRFPYGYFNYRMACTIDCGGWPECPPFSPFRVKQRMQMQFPAPLPSNATIWAYEPNNATPAPQWQQLPARIDGRLATVALEGGMYGMSWTERDNILRGTVAVSIPPAVSTEYDWKGMWWGGLAENGWGLSLSQESDRLFGVLYVYDDNGRPAWLAMGNGRWDPAKSAYNAQLYRPLSPSGDGEVVGSVQLSSQTPGSAMLEYTVGGMNGLKMISKMASNIPADARVYAGAWDEVPLGGGLTIDASGGSLFIGWPTFLDEGEPTWLLMPGGSWTAASTYEGTLYRTKGSRWIGLGYDANALQVSAAGSMKIVFTDADRATLSYVVDGQSGSRAIVRKRF